MATSRYRRVSGRGVRITRRRVTENNFPNRFVELLLYVNYGTAARLG